MGIFAPLCSSRKFIAKKCNFFVKACRPEGVKKMRVYFFFT